MVSELSPRQTTSTSSNLCACGKETIHYDRDDRDESDKRESDKSDDCDNIDESESDNRNSRRSTPSKTQKENQKDVFRVFRQQTAQKNIQTAQVLKKKQNMVYPTVRLTIKKKPFKCNIFPTKRYTRRAQQQTPV